MISPATPIDAGQIARHYDALDPFYRKLWGEHLHHGLWQSGRETAAQAVVQMVHEIARRAAIGPGSQVCDVGCGYGATAGIFAADYDARVTGYTVSPVQHARARACALKDSRLEFELKDWLAARAAPDAFDAVIAIESSEHFEDKPRFFAEAARVLRPGGRLVVCAWLAAETTRRWQRRLLLEPICTEGRLPSLATAGEYRAWIETAGLTLVSFEDVTARVRRTWSVVTTRMIRQMRDPGTWRLLLDPEFPDRVFALTVLRIRLAYHTGCMRYALFTAARPTQPAGAGTAHPRP